MLRNGGFPNKRSQIVPMAHGRILEIGIGSGLNFDHYNFDKVEEIIGVDPAVSSVAMARSRSSKYNSKISFHRIKRRINRSAIQHF